MDNLLKAEPQAVDTAQARTMRTVSLAGVEAMPVIPKIKKERQGWLKFGEKNDFPTRLMELIGGSPVQSSIIRSAVTYTVGKGVCAAEEGKYIGQPNKLNSWTELFRLLATDFKISDAFYFQVIVNKDGASVSLFHHDWTEVRVGRLNDDGTPASFRISKDWAKTTGKNKPLELDVWPGSVDAAEKGKAYMYYYWGYQPGMSYYSLPDYYPANRYIKADGSLAEFYDNSIENGFIVSTVVTMPINPPEEQKKQYEREFTDAFTGPKGTTQIVFIWGEGDAPKPAITPFNSTQNADVYNDIEGIIFQKIISANRLASPTLAGVSGSGNLSGNAAEIIDAYVLYNSTVINELRQTLLNILNIFTKINGVGAIAIEDLGIVRQIDGQAAEATTSTADEGGDGEENTAGSTKLRRKSPFLSALKKLNSLLWK